MKASMFYLLAIVTFLAGCVLALGYIGRNSRPDGKRAPRDETT